MKKSKVQFHFDGIDDDIILELRLEELENIKAKFLPFIGASKKDIFFFDYMVKSRLKEIYECELPVEENSERVQKMIFNGSLDNLKKLLAHLWIKNIIKELTDNQILQYFYVNDQKNQELTLKASYKKIVCYNNTALAIFIRMLKEKKMLVGEYGIPFKFNYYFCDKNGKHLDDRSLQKLYSKGNEREKNLLFKKFLEKEIQFIKQNPSLNIELI